MRVVPRKDLDKDLLMPYQPLKLENDGEEDRYIPAEAYPLKLIHSDNSGFVILLMDETDDNSTIMAHSADFDFILDYETEPNTDFFEDLERLLTKHFKEDWTWRYKDSGRPLTIYSESLADAWDKMVEEEATVWEESKWKQESN